MPIVRLLCADIGASRRAEATSLVHLNVPEEPGAFRRSGSAKRFSDQKINEKQQSAQPPCRLGPKQCVATGGTNCRMELWSAEVGDAAAVPEFKAFALDTQKVCWCAARTSNDRLQVYPSADFSGLAQLVIKCAA